MYRIQGIKTSFYVCRFCDPFKYRFQHRKIAHEYEQVCVFSRLCIVICLDWSAISIWFKFYSLPCYTLPLLFLLCVYSIFIDIFAFHVGKCVFVCVCEVRSTKRSHILTLDRNSKISFYSFEFKLNTCSHAHAYWTNGRTDWPIDHSWELRALKW